MMRWFTAHVIMWVHFKDGNQDRYPIWENVYLIEAQSHEAAREKAAERAKVDEGDDSGSFMWDHRPAEWVFGGVRKTVSCDDDQLVPHDGVELTYSEFEVSSSDQLALLTKGESVPVTYIE